MNRIKYTLLIRLGKAYFQWQVIGYCYNTEKLIIVNFFHRGEGYHFDSFLKWLQLYL